MHIRPLILLVALALVLAACGGATEETEAVAETTTTTTSTTTTTTTTTLPAETTTTAPAVDPMALIAAQISGTYAGEWRNTTFGSSGPISASLEASEEGVVSVTLDVDGFVFGEADPDAEEFSFDIADATVGATMESAVFGILTFSFTPNGIMVEALDVPSPAIASMQVLASLVEDGFVGTYVIEFEGGGSAEGEFDMTPTG